MASPRKPSPRLAGSALRAASRAAGLPVVDQAFIALLRKQTGLDALDAIRFQEDEPPYVLPRALEPIARPGPPGAAPGTRSTRKARSTSPRTKTGRKKVTRKKAARRKTARRKAGGVR